MPSDPAASEPRPNPLDLSRRWFVSVAARRYDGGGYSFHHSAGFVDECDDERAALGWGAEWAEASWPARHGWKHHVIVLKADRND